MKDFIRIRGARQHNLKAIDLDIPRRAITVITGVSGSGKSSLAFDTLYAEGQRRYVESLSAYARQFLERMEKPAVDRIEGISPTVAIEQRNPVKSSRSTVGTATEIYDYLRLLWARIGHSFCPVCGREVKPDTVQSATDAVLRLPEGTRFMIVFPLAASTEASTALVSSTLKARGFVRVAVPVAAKRDMQSPPYEVHHLDDLSGTSPDFWSRSGVLAVVDRLTAGPASRPRVAEAFQTAFAEGNGYARVILLEPTPEPDLAVSGAASGEEPDTQVNTSRWEMAFSEHFECPHDGTVLVAPTPQLFSFNNPRGACPTCNGFGATLGYDIGLIVPHPERSVREGAIAPWTAPRYEKQRRQIVDFARDIGVSPDAPWHSLPASAQEQFLHSKGRGYIGIFPFLSALEEKRYKQYIRVFLRQYQSARTCPTCGGARLQPAALNVKIQGHAISKLTQWSILKLRDWLETLRLTDGEAAIAESILRESRSRSRFLVDTGLGYLTLDRSTRTLSGGEAQRISIANALGAALVDATYVLDEPSIGLHPRDMDRLLSLLRRLRDGGNTVVMVEHDPDAMRIADHMIELGPGAGANGGEIVFSGPMSDIHESPLTGQYLTGVRRIDPPSSRRPVGPRWIELRGARAHNLHNVDVKIPLGALTVVTGVSGSGKSTLVHDVLFHALENRLHGEHSAKEHLGETVGDFTLLSGVEQIDDVVLVDQSPIGRSPRSNPVTYVKAFDEVRRLFADTPLAKAQGFTAGHFSFNVAGGRCDNCDGAGSIEVEMVFMADVFVPCEVCGGKRFKPEVLDVRIRGKNIADVLELTVDEAIRFFPREDKLAQALWQVQQVGLGYLRLGQPAQTLSGGEAQRLKIARELALTSRDRAKKLYIMDEPTTGLHLEDIKTLVQVFDRLLAQGHTLLLVEHHLDVIKRADWLIDMGPEGGESGGRVVAMGRPEDIVSVSGSHTGRWLKPVLESVVPA